MNSKRLQIKKAAGFTLIELLVAVTLLTILLAAVYSSFAAVIDTTDIARQASLEIRSRQFLSRSFTHNLAQATEGWSPGAAFRTDNSDQTRRGENGTVDVGEIRYWFEGTDEGDSDTLSFVSTAPLAGVAAFPGTVKLVTYTVSQEASDSGDFDAFAEPDASVLEVTESPLAFSSAGLELTNSGGTSMRDQMAEAAEAIGMESVTWSIPVETMNIQYFDGKEWTDSWDSQEKGHLPWSVDVRINFANDGAAAEVDAQQDPMEDPDFRLVFSIPAGAGIRDEPPGYNREDDGQEPGTQPVQSR